MIQIDGLSATRLDRALRDGDLPSLARLIQEGARLEARVSAAPPSTPVFQSSLLYGRQRVVHGYSWFDRRTGRVCRMDNPRDVAEMEAQLEAGCSSQPLLGIGRGTVSYFMNFIGGAGRAALSMATGILPQPGWKARRIAAALARGVARVPREIASAVGDMIRFVRAQRTTRFEWNFLAMRLINAAAFEEVATLGAMFDVRNGAPIVYINFIGYDEAAHRRGPDHEVGFEQLRRIDRHVSRLIDAASRRGYEIVVMSDHGQASCVPFERATGSTLAATVMRACAPSAVDDGATALAEGLHEARVRAARVGKWPGALGRVAATRSMMEARRAARRLEEEHAIPAGEIAVVTGGSVAHVYVGRDEQGSSLERISARFPRLIPTLVSSPGIGLVVARRTSEGPLVHYGGRWARLDDLAALARLEPFREIGVSTLAGLIRHSLVAPSGGDLVLYGAFAHAGAVSFERELGSHGGVHPDELELFILCPAHLPLPDGGELHPAELGKSLRIRYATA